MEISFAIRIDFLIAILVIIAGIVAIFLEMRHSLDNITKLLEEIKNTINEMMKSIIAIEERTRLFVEEGKRN